MSFLKPQSLSSVQNLRDNGGLMHSPRSIPSRERPILDSLDSIDLIDESLNSVKKLNKGGSQRLLLGEKRNFSES